MSDYPERYCVVCRDVFTPWRKDQIMCSSTYKRGVCQGRLYKAEASVIVAYHYALQRQGYGCHWCHVSGLTGITVDAEGRPTPAPSGNSERVVAATFARIHPVLLEPWNGVDSKVVAGCLPCRQKHYVLCATAP